MGLRWNEEQAYGRLFLILFLHRNNKGVCWISVFFSSHRAHSSKESSARVNE